MEFRVVYMPLEIISMTLPRRYCSSCYRIPCEHVVQPSCTVLRAHFFPLRLAHRSKGPQSWRILPSLPRLPRQSKAKVMTTLASHELTQIEKEYFHIDSAVIPVICLFTPLTHIRTKQCRLHLPTAHLRTPSRWLTSPSCPPGSYFALYLGLDGVPGCRAVAVRWSLLH